MSGDEPGPNSEYTIGVEYLLNTYRPGSGDWSWGEEFVQLRVRDAEALDALREDVRENGIREPLTLGDDGRLWDGHHRLLVAVDLGIERVPCMLGQAVSLPAAATSDEVETVSKTGGRKGKKDAQLGAIDPVALLELAKVAGYGGLKYERYNYLSGYDWSLCMDAMQRHILAFWSGQDLDPESGLPHAAHAAWHCLALVSFMLRHPQYDDRPPRLHKQAAHASVPARDAEEKP